METLNDISGVYKQLTFTRTLNLKTEGKTLEQEKEFWTIEDKVTH